MSRLSETDIKMLLLEKIRQQSPQLSRVVKVTVVTDEPWNRYNCKFDVGEVTTHWMFLTMNTEGPDFQFRVDDLVANVFFLLRMKGKAA